MQIMKYGVWVCVAFSWCTFVFAGAGDTEGMWSYGTVEGQTASGKTGHGEEIALEARTTLSRMSGIRSGYLSLIRLEGKENDVRFGGFGIGARRYWGRYFIAPYLGVGVVLLPPEKLEYGGGYEITDIWIAGNVEAGISASIGSVACIYVFTRYYWVSTGRDDDLSAHGVGIGLKF